MKKNIVKIGFVLIILFIILATTVNADFISDIQTNMNQGSNIKDTVVSTGNKVLGAIEVIGTGIAILMLMYIGIKIIIAAPEEKAKFKKTSVMYVIGAVVFFVGPRLVSLIAKMAENLTAKL